jgi:hypothetical protein
MLGKQKIKKIFTSNYYEVKNEIKLKLGEGFYSNISTFNLFIKKLNSLKYDIFLDRSNFKVNGEEIEKKFSLLSHEYFSCIFPLRFSIRANKLVVINFKEVMARITEKNLDLKEDYDGDGLDYIRQQFLDQVDTSDKLQIFVSSLSIVKIIELSLQRFTENPTIDLQWQMPGVYPLDFKIAIQGNDNMVTYKSENKSKALFVSQLNVYNQENNLIIIPDTDQSPFVATFNQTVNYEGDTLGFNDSQTIIKTSLDNYYDYEENIFLQSKV